MRKLISLILVSLFTVLTFAGCGTEENPSSSEATSTETVATSSKDVTTSNAVSTSSKKESSSSKPKKPSSKVKTSSKEEEEEIFYSAKEKIYHGMDKNLYKLSLKREGDPSRIAALMKKAQKGGNYKIAVIGGSISQGAGASSVLLSYGNLVNEWWAANFPNSTFEFINAGLGSTNPEMACYRIEADLLKYNPDFVVVDFAVNYVNCEDPYNTLSTILYRILSQKNSPAVMSIDFTNCSQNNYGQKPSGLMPAALSNAMKDYNIPGVSYHNYVWEKIEKRVIKWEDIGSDYVHPNDNGHLLAANIIGCYLDNLKKNLSKVSTKITAPKMPNTNKYLNIGYITNTAKNVKLSGGFFARDNKSAKARGWMYKYTGEPSSLTIPVPENKAVKVFMYFNHGDSGVLTITDSNNKAKTIRPSDAKNPTLVNLGSVSGNITITPDLDVGEFIIFGIGIDYK